MRIFPACILKGINHKDNFDGMTQWWLKSGRLHTRHPW
jgi:hypothetical protein